MASTRNSKSIRSKADAKAGRSVDGASARPKGRAWRLFQRKLFSCQGDWIFPTAAGEGEPLGIPNEAGDASISERGCLVATGVKFQGALSRRLHSGEKGMEKLKEPKERDR